MPWNFTNFNIQSIQLITQISHTATVNLSKPINILK